MLRFGFWSVCLVSPRPSCRLFSPLSPLSGRYLNVQCVTDWLLTQCGSGSRGVEGFEHQFDGDHYAALDRSERSTSSDPRGPWTHHLHPGGRCGGGGGRGGGALGRHAGVLSGFGAPRAKIGYPSMSLTIGCGRHISGPHRILVEVGPQGVPQTGKIIEVKRRLSGSFFSISEGLAVLFGVEWHVGVSQERW